MNDSNTPGLTINNLITVDKTAPSGADISSDLVLCQG
jgi:hypothetical protein